MNELRNLPNDEHPGDPNCEHNVIDIIGGGGDDKGVWDTFQCTTCKWTFNLITPEGL